MKSNSNKGFTLIEMAIVVGIFGLLLGSILSVINPLNKMRKEAETREKMEIIADAIANYASIKGQIPCPAAPQPNTAANAGNMYVAGAIPNCSVAANRVGIVPFRTLGIHPDNAIDGWGHYFTYVVSPVFAMNPVATVHQNCRDTKWISGGSNLNPTKAKFCCPAVSTYAATTDITIRDSSGNSLFQTRGTGGGTYAAVDTSGVFNAALVTAAPAFLVISHGSNGYGAYRTNSSSPTSRSTVIAASAHEIENADDDGIFVFAPKNSTNGANYYDDILLWRTQDAIMYEFGNDSCFLP